MIIFGARRCGQRTLSSILMRRRVDQYTATLAGLIVPAILAALAASVLYADVKPQLEPTSSLYERVEQMRAAAAKTPLHDMRISHGADSVRVITLHEPVGDLSLATGEVLEEGS